MPAAAAVPAGTKVVPHKRRASGQRKRQGWMAAEVGARVYANKGREPKVQAATDEEARRFAACRALGHEWHHVGWADPLATPPVGAGWQARGFVSTCSHCGTTRTKWISRYGNTTDTRYDYPAGYQRTGEQKLSPAEWRRTWRVSLLGDD